jgi:hypothetical protein
MDDDFWGNDPELEEALANYPLPIPQPQIPQPQIAQPQIAQPQIPPVLPNHAAAYESLAQVRYTYARALPNARPEELPAIQNALTATNALRSHILVRSPQRNRNGSRFAPFKRGTSNAKSFRRCLFLLQKEILPRLEALPPVVRENIVEASSEAVRTSTSSSNERNSKQPSITNFFAPRGPQPGNDNDDNDGN